MYNTRRFAERSLRALIVHSSRLEAALDSLQLEQQFVGNELGYLMLRDSKTMFGVAADAPESPEMDEPRAALYTRVVEPLLTGDGTTKISLALKVQRRRRGAGARAPVGSEGSAWTAHETIHAVYSVRTSMGAELGLVRVP